MSAHIRRLRFAIAIYSLAAAIALIGLATPAAADAIDGNWCAKSGERLSINGPALVTPKGNRLNGDYSRHAFAYVVPQAEPGAGDQISMSLIDEETMLLTRASVKGGAAGSPETWRRCSAIS